MDLVIEGISFVDAADKHSLSRDPLAYIQQVFWHDRIVVSRRCRTHHLLLFRAFYVVLLVRLGVQIVP